MAKKEEVTVLLDGQGADEIFAGYHYFFGFYFMGLIKKYPFKTLIREILSLIKNKEFKYAIFSLCFLLLPTPLKKSFFRNKSYISESLYNSKDNTTNYYENFYSCNSLHDCLNFHLNHKLEHLLSWEDKNSMAHSRESRVPFLDKRLISFVSKLPEDFIIKNGTTKNILRDSIKSLIPHKILNRRDKIGFATPDETWVQSPEFQKQFRELLIDKKPATDKYLDRNKIESDFERLVRIS